MIRWLRLLVLALVTIAGLGSPAPSDCCDDERATVQSDGGPTAPLVVNAEPPPSGHTPACAPGCVGCCLCCPTISQAPDTFVLAEIARASLLLPSDRSERVPPLDHPDEILQVPKRA